MMLIRRKTLSLFATYKDGWVNKTPLELDCCSNLDTVTRRSRMDDATFRSYKFVGPCIYVFLHHILHSKCGSVVFHRCRTEACMRPTFSRVCVINSVCRQRVRRNGEAKSWWHLITVTYTPRSVCACALFSACLLAFLIPVHVITLCPYHWSDTGLLISSRNHAPPLQTANVNCRIYMQHSARIRYTASPKI